MTFFDMYLAMLLALLTQQAISIAITYLWWNGYFDKETDNA